MIQKNIAFVCQRELPVEFSTLIINVESIEKLYPDGYKGFYLNDKFSNTFTNGSLVIFSEMMSYPSYLYRIIEEELRPHGFEHGRDYVMAFEEHIDDIGLDTLEWYHQVEWLEVDINPNLGLQAYHKDFDADFEAFRSSLTLDYPWTQYWYYWYQKHPVLRDIRLKKRVGGYPMFYLETKFYDEVPNEVFGTYESDRISFFLGSQFGVHPKPESDYLKDYIGYAAVLGKSMLSGHVAGLSIYSLVQGELREKLLFIENTTIINNELNQKNHDF